VEEQGALRVCLLVTGHLYSAQGLRFCPYKLRIHLYAGKADLRIFHTFVFDQDPTRIQLKAIGLKVFAKTGDGAVAAVGGEGATAHFSRNLTPGVNGYATMGAIGCDQVRERPNAANTTSGQLSILQSDDLHYAAKLNDQPFGAGGKATGWASLSGPEASVVAGIRDFWQEYPKGFAVSSAGIDIRIWPEDAPQPLSFLSPFDEPPVNFNGTRDEEEIKRLTQDLREAMLRKAFAEVPAMDETHVRRLHEALCAMDFATDAALAVRRATGAKIGISITGVAGPGGGLPDKPVGREKLSRVHRWTLLRQWASLVDGR
jgi:hypothetical protein